MSEELEVHIQIGADTHRVGTLYTRFRGRNESSTFAYHQDWLNNPEGFAIQPDMPLGSGRYHNSPETGVLPGSISDGAPDRWGRQLVRRMLAKADRDQPISEVSYLLNLDDTSRIGALRYRLDEDGPFLQKSDGRTVPPLITIGRLLNAADAVQRDSESTEDLLFLLGQGSPLGGARPKSAILERDGSLAIAKFPQADEVRNTAAGEALMAALAKRANIDVAGTRLVSVDDRPVSIIRRFDRDEDGNRRHFISAMTMVGARSDDDATYRDVALAIRRYSAEPQRDAHELFRRATFNVLASNFDDHLRNHAFLYDHDKAKWALSPAYDMNPVPASEKPRHMTTWLTEGGSEATIEPLIEVSKDFMLDKDQARQIARDVADVTAQWRDVGRKMGIADADLSYFETAFDHRESRALLNSAKPTSPAPTASPKPSSSHGPGS